MAQSPRNLHHRSFIQSRRLPLRLTCAGGSSASSVQCPEMTIKSNQYSNENPYTLANLHTFEAPDDSGHGNEPMYTTWSYRQSEHSGHFIVQQLLLATLARDSMVNCRSSKVPVSFSWASATVSHYQLAFRPFRVDVTRAYLSDKPTRLFEIY